jgi:hypothetical protein
MRSGVFILYKESYAMYKYILSLFAVLLISSSVYSQEYTINFLTLRHSNEGIAHEDAGYARQAVKKGQEANLKIYYIGETSVVGWSAMDVQRYITKQIKEYKQADLFIVHTIGHGTPSVLREIRGGDRTTMTHVFANAACDNKQHILWWMLNCYAGASESSYNSLPEKHKEYLTVLASSPANAISGVGKQGPIMSKLFENISKLDNNKDSEVINEEFSHFLNSFSPPRGNLLFGSKTYKLFSSRLNFNLIK